MSKEQIAKMMDSLAADNLSSMENAYDSVYRLVLDAMVNGGTKEVKAQFSDFYDKEAQLAELLGVMDAADDPETETGRAALDQYWFGQIKALTDLLADYVKRERDLQSFRELGNHSKHLNAFLVIISQNPRISGTELRQKLQMKDSNFSNFIKRVEPYHLFSVSKSGNTKYYILSPKGRRYLRDSGTEKPEKPARRYYDEDFLVCLLRFLAGELKTAERPSAARVILQVNLHREKKGALEGNIPVLKHAVKQVFRASEYRQRQKLQSLMPQRKSAYSAAWSAPYGERFSLNAESYITAYYQEE